MPDNSGQPYYKVTRQEVGTKYHPNGRTEKTWTVHVEHPDGTVATVEMPDAYYTARNVHQAIVNQAEQVQAVANLPDSVAGLPALPPPSQR